MILEDGNPVWRGRPDGYPVVTVVPVPGCQDAALLLKMDAEGSPTRFANLLRIGPDGVVQWRAAPPDTDSLAQDVWVSVQSREDEGLTANSWSCYLCTIDPESGTIMSSVFTK